MPGFGVVDEDHPERFRTRNEEDDGLGEFPDWSDWSGDEEEVVFEEEEV